MESDQEESGSEDSNDENAPQNGMDLDEDEDVDAPAPVKKKAAPAPKGNSKTASETYQKVRYYN